MELNEAAVLRFPMRKSLVVWITRDGAAWSVISGDHGWLFGSQRAAEFEAQWLSRNLGLPIRAVTS
jgi:hypothetical protein